VQRAGNQLLAGAGLAEDADAGLARGDTVDLRHHFAHGFAGVDDLVLADALAELAVLIFEALEFEGVVDGEEKLVGGERLFEEVDGAQARGAYRHLDIRLAGDHHHRNRDPRVADVL
jgi:hypothetical protein